MIHYSGSICYDGARSTAHVGGGYAACCSGDRAIRVRNEGLGTTEPELVTCRRCLAILPRRVDCVPHRHFAISQERRGVALHRGHRVEVTREPSMAGDELLFYSVFRDRDGFECDSGFENSDEAVVDKVRQLVERVDAELLGENPWGECG